MKTIRIRKGLTLNAVGAPQQIVSAAAAVQRVAWQPPPNATLQADKLVEVGQQVRQGEPLFTDRHSPDICHVAPHAGTISGIVVDEQSTLLRIEIDCSDQTPRQFTPCSAQPDPQEVRHLLQSSGLWTHVRQRPFEITPETDSSPYAICVTAMDSRPLAPDPVGLINASQSLFDSGITALCSQTSGTLWICQAPGKPVTLLEHPAVKLVAFAGNHPAGTPGVHMQKLCPATYTHPVWHVDYQDVIAIGNLVQHGLLNFDRIISLAGSLINRPRLIRTQMGAHIGDLLNQEVNESSGLYVPIVGSLLAKRSSQWLGRFDRQLIATTQVTPSETGSKPLYRGFVAEPRFDRINSLDILPVPLLRAVVSQNLTVAEQLGCLELAGEDLDLFSYICPEGNDYANALADCNLQLKAQSLLEPETVT